MIMLLLSVNGCIFKISAILYMDRVFLQFHIDLHCALHKDLELSYCAPVRRIDEPFISYHSIRAIGASPPPI